MRALFFFFLFMSAFSTNADILDESEFVKQNEKGDIQNLLNYMNMYYKNKNCCNDTAGPSPSPAPVPPSPSPSPSQPTPFKWRGIIYMEILDIIENNIPELQIT